MKEKLIAALNAQGYMTFTRFSELNIIGVRSSDLTPNVFNDTIHVLYQDQHGEWQLFSYSATTDPGTYWLMNPAMPEGTAILKTGQYLNAYMIGLHRNQYAALVQRAPVTVIRDPERNGKLDFSGRGYTGMLGINIHRAAQTGTTKTVEKYSAGCQVFANAEDFHAFMDMCMRHKALYGNVFTYTLLNEDDLNAA